MSTHTRMIKNWKNLTPHCFVTTFFIAGPRIFALQVVNSCYKFNFFSRYITSFFLGSLENMKNVLLHFRFEGLRASVKTPCPEGDIQKWLNSYQISRSKAFAVSFSRPKITFSPNKWQPQTWYELFSIAIITATESNSLRKAPLHSIFAQGVRNIILALSSPFRPIFAANFYSARITSSATSERRLRQHFPSNRFAIKSLFSTQSPPA